MDIITYTPFNEYREEQSGIKLTDYFVPPEFFDQMSDNKPKLIYGARGTGKTTVLKALTIEQADNKKAFLEEKNYIGFYYRTDLNIANAFFDKDHSDDFWHKLFSYYFVCSISLEVIRQIDSVKELLNAEEEEICRELSPFFCVEDEATTFSQLIRIVKNEEKKIEVFINNIPYIKPPIIGAFAKMLREIPRIIFDHCDQKLTKDKHFIYLIDEFESLNAYQQKAIFSLVKYADQRHTYIIGLRPLGLKELSTVGEEYIRETDDYNTYILDSGTDKYREFARKVCDKRIELFYKKHFSSISNIPTVYSFFEQKPVIDEFVVLFQNKKYQEKHAKRVTDFLHAFGITDSSVETYLIENQEKFYLMVLKTIKNYNNKTKKTTITKREILEEIEAFKCPDETHKEFIHNYRNALVFYTYRLYGKSIVYSSFHTLVSLSGNTLRYLLEMCNEIFLRMYRNFPDLYQNPRLIPISVQSEEILSVSQRRFEQIKAVPDLGPSMRRFMSTLGTLASIRHDDSRISVFEPNHFSIRADSQIHENITQFLIECVFRGVLILFEDNKIKVKYKIGYDQNIYQIHPIYTPKFQISSRRKQKIDFPAQEISVMIGNDNLKINQLIKKYKDSILSNKIEDIIAYLKGKQQVVDSEQATFFEHMGEDDYDEFV
jgi:hypothetical protein